MKRYFVQINWKLFSKSVETVVFEKGFTDFVSKDLTMIVGFGMMNPSSI